MDPSPQLKDQAHLTIRAEALPDSTKPAFTEQPNLLIPSSEREWRVEEIFQSLSLAIHASPSTLSTHIAKFFDHYQQFIMARILNHNLTFEVSSTFSPLLDRARKLFPQSNIGLLELLKIDLEVCQGHISKETALQKFTQISSDFSPHIDMPAHFQVLLFALLIANSPDEKTQFEYCMMFISGGESFIHAHDKDDLSIYTIFFNAVLKRGIALLERDKALCTHIRKESLETGRKLRMFSYSLNADTPMKFTAAWEDLKRRVPKGAFVVTQLSKQVVALCQSFSAICFPNRGSIKIKLPEEELDQTIIKSCHNQEYVSLPMIVVQSLQGLLSEKPIATMQVGGVFSLFGMALTWERCAAKYCPSLNDSLRLSFTLSEQLQAARNQEERLNGLLYWIAAIKELYKERSILEDRHFKQIAIQVRVTLRISQKQGEKEFYNLSGVVQGVLGGLSPRYILLLDDDELRESLCEKALPFIALFIEKDLPIDQILKILKPQTHKVFIRLISVSIIMFLHHKSNNDRALQRKALFQAVARVILGWEAQEKKTSALLLSILKIFPEVADDKESWLFLIERIQSGINSALGKTKGRENKMALRRAFLALQPILIRYGTAKIPASEFIPLFTLMQRAAIICKDFEQIERFSQAVAYAARLRGSTTSFLDCFVGAKKSFTKETTKKTKSQSSKHKELDSMKEQLEALEKKLLTAKANEEQAKKEVHALTAELELLTEEAKREKVEATRKLEEQLEKATQKSILLLEEVKQLKISLEGKLQRVQELEDELEEAERIQKALLQEQALKAATFAKREKKLLEMERRADYAKARAEMHEEESFIVASLCKTNVLCCPISHEIPQDPVILTPEGLIRCHETEAWGDTNAIFERTAIQEWLILKGVKAEELDKYLMPLPFFGTAIIRAREASKKALTEPPQTAKGEDMRKIKSASPLNADGILYETNDIEVFRVSIGQIQESIEKLHTLPCDTTVQRFREEAERQLHPLRLTRLLDRLQVPLTVRSASMILEGLIKDTVIIMEEVAKFTLSTQPKEEGVDHVLRIRIKGQSSIAAHSHKVSALCTLALTHIGKIDRFRKEFECLEQQGVNFFRPEYEPRDPHKSTIYAKVAGIDRTLRMSPGEADIKAVAKSIPEIYAWIHTILNLSARMLRAFELHHHI